MELSIFQRTRTTRIVNKKIRRLGSSLLLHNSNQEDLINLSKKGILVLKESISLDLIKMWIERYSLKNDNIYSASGNISFPFFNSEIYDILRNSSIVSILQDYFGLMYSQPAILQIIPSLIISYPNIEQNEFDLTENNYPAVWHVDYPYEFTIHIPLFDINANTSHTEYILKSHCSFYKPKIKSSNVVSCNCNSGDVLMLDVEGWHKAFLIKNSFRVLIQFKYTIGNDILVYNPTAKYKKNVQRTLSHIKNYVNLNEILSDDLKFLNSLNLAGDKYNKVILDNKKMYDDYLL